MSATERTLQVWRATWRYDHWSSTSSAKSRMFARASSAERFAEKLERRGAHVTLARANRTIHFVDVERGEIA